ncbi:3-hydroxybutyrate oligomer hydrolase family protein [Pseudomarimonas arenosa]|uniref:Hydrogenase n=1 Tax=Pseudomarimonas arenosa TaxID=2774145 RepID=A0AAW3ZQF7_9GAMM|nr:3-hydroxybutyrate oligomer hydrolase family protein [Pseudomarimonas arenosa]MBD8526521.1 hydrogenase [Pseudomarimonas arenosa]
MISAAVGGRGRFPPTVWALALSLVLSSTLLGGCGSNQGTTSEPAATPTAQAASFGEIVGAPQRSEHRGDDELLSAGLGLPGLRALTPPELADPAAPSAAELRRRAVWANWRGIADLRPGEHGEAYGSLAAVPGIEVRVQGRLRDSGAEHHLLFQLPDDFNAERPCLVVSAASGSRGEYGAIALVGGWGLPRGCAVVTTDKGAGSHWTQGDGAIHVPHAHSGQHPEAHWGEFVLAAAEFGLQQLSAERAQRYDADTTQILAVGISNGGGAVLQAAGISESLFDAVIAIAPNVLPASGGRALYDYATEAALLMPCAMLDPRFESVPFARPQPLGEARCRLLAERGEIDGASVAERSAAALARLRQGGWTDAALDTAGFSAAFDLWRAVGVTYASSYLRADAQSMPCGYRFEFQDAEGRPAPASAPQQALWWSDSSGIPPSAGVKLIESPSAQAPADDPGFAGLACLRDLWLAEHSPVHGAVNATRAALPPTALPIYVLHGEADGLVPIAFSSQPYVEWLQSEGRRPVFERLPDAQHFDAYVGLPPWSGKHPALMPHAYALIDRAVADLAKH